MFFFKSSAKRCFENFPNGNQPSQLHHLKQAFRREDVTLLLGSMVRWRLGSWFWCYGGSRRKSGEAVEDDFPFPQVGYLGSLEGNGFLKNIVPYQIDLNGSADFVGQ